MTYGYTTVKSLGRALAFAVIVGVFLSPVTASAGEPKACRSVHLWYKGTEGDAFYNEVVPEQSARGTYFCVCGFDGGYFGIQELVDGKKLAIFSVWDNHDDNSTASPNSVPNDYRVKLIYKDPSVRVGRFGNEGTGGQSFYDIDWQTGETYKFLVKATRDMNRTVFTAYLATPPQYAWRKLASFSSLGTGGKLIAGDYCFIEDFRRDATSVKQQRAARFQNCWSRDQSHTWIPQQTVQFSADNNKRTNIDAGLEQNGFFLRTGGDTTNINAHLGDTLSVVTSQSPPVVPE